jgi:hypothetical protein
MLLPCAICRQWCQWRVFGYGQACKKARIFIWRDDVPAVRGSTQDERGNHGYTERFHNGFSVLETGWVFGEKK